MDKNGEYRFLKACRGEPVDCTPVWFMRQAGRYMKEYRDLKAKYSFLEMCRTPELATEVTLQPLDVLGVDAAIIFADILLPLEPMGTGLEFTAGDGPSIPRPVRTRKDVDNLRPVNSEEQLGYVGDAIKLVRKEIAGKLPLIGFSGAPFTLSSYMVEGGKSKEFTTTKLMMYQEPETWNRLMDKVVDVLVDYLKMQVKAGAQALQIFDSWVGCLNPGDYERYILPHTKRVFDGLKECGVPVINFSTGTSTMLPLVRQSGGDVMGFDWRIHLDDARKQIGLDTPVQGNLDPNILFAPIPVIREKVLDILKRAEGRPGHIFNLGHGILQHTPVDHVKAVVDMVHEYQHG
ncbi:Uroporphyrinogen decarboxylase [Nitrospina gracilis 3/211]|uniref:Uroporphyrinogen decarboxylase n=1 Tax=Nitrospina gracilis (strain 3/211) TaxID=1266370 RepID=M1YIN3_NITG3|nr:MULTISPECIES: uroporphyrinogen decarboxylase [Nitrospina]MCF8723303.1 uroporphyrinogen decarboxylase [Nitrospina sp. Nb-3]CCQ90353.1 Uroporphyrinogen decarboxylase [Nitrospina gracilis 3/211]